MAIEVNIDELSSTVEINTETDNIINIDIENVENPIDVSINTNFIAHNHTYEDILGLGEDIQDVIGGMISSNNEAGLSVTYDDTTGKINFDVNDPVITLNGDVAGSATMSNLGNVTITTSVANDSHNHSTSTIDNFVEEVKSLVRNMTYVHNQGVASDTWTMNHNLGYFPNIEIVNSAGDTVIGNYQFVSVNTVIATFSDPFAGKAYLS